MFCCFFQNYPKFPLLKKQSRKWTKLLFQLSTTLTFFCLHPTKILRGIKKIIKKSSAQNEYSRRTPSCSGDLFPHAPRWHNDTLQETPGNIAHLITECKPAPPLKPQPHIYPHCPSSDGRDSGCENQSCPHATLQGLVTAVSKTCAFSSTHTPVWAVPQ